MVKRGDINFTMSHIPPKNFVCCIFQMQYHKPNQSVDPKGTQQQHKYMISLYSTVIKQCHNQMCTTFNNDANNATIMNNNEK